MTTEKRLQEAIEAGERVQIKYNGGSQPGVLRHIGPIVLKDGKVRARCYNSNVVKLFMVKKIKIMKDQGNISIAKWNSEKKPTKRFKSIIELLEKENGFFTELGWHIENDKDRISLHRRYKNGNAMKRPDVSLNYEELTCDLVIGLDGEEHEENIRKRQRPWIVRGKKQSTKTFGSLNKAAEMFMDWAKLLAPGN